MKWTVDIFMGDGGQGKWSGSFRVGGKEGTIGFSILFVHNVE